MHSYPATIASKKTLTSDDLAAIFGVEPGTIRSRLYRRQLPPARKVGRDSLWDAAEFWAWAWPSFCNGNGPTVPFHWWPQVDIAQEPNVARAYRCESASGLTATYTIARPRQRVMLFYPDGLDGPYPHEYLPSSDVLLALTRFHQGNSIEITIRQLGIDGVLKTTSKEVARQLGRPMPFIPECLRHLDVPLDQESPVRRMAFDVRYPDPSTVERMSEHSKDPKVGSALKELAAYYRSWAFDQAANSITSSDYPHLRLCAEPETVPEVDAPNLSELFDRPSSIGEWLPDLSGTESKVATVRLPETPGPWDSIKNRLVLATDDTWCLGHTVAAGHVGRGLTGPIPSDVVAATDPVTGAFFAWRRSEPRTLCWVDRRIPRERPSDFTAEQFSERAARTLGDTVSLASIVMGVACEIAAKSDDDFNDTVHRLLGSEGVDVARATCLALTGDPDIVYLQYTDGPLPAGNGMKMAMRIAEELRERGDWWSNPGGTSPVNWPKTTMFDLSDPTVPLALVGRDWVPLPILDCGYNAGYRGTGPLTLAWAMNEILHGRHPEYRAGVIADTGLEGDVPAVFGLDVARHLVASRQEN